MNGFRNAPVKSVDAQETRDWYMLLTVCIHAHTHTQIHTYTHTHTHTASSNYGYGHTYTCMHTDMQNICMRAYMQAHIHTATKHTYLRTHKHTHIYMLAQK